MGFIREPFGRIAIESRRESFIIHPGYGYKLASAPLGEHAAIGLEFIADQMDLGEGRRWTICLMDEDGVQGRESITGLKWRFPYDKVVEWPDIEEKAEGTFAERWRQGHPEFLNEDLDDLIRALQDLRAGR